jgi:hypothetical protein
VNHEKLVNKGLLGGLPNFCSSKVFPRFFPANLGVNDNPYQGCPDLCAMPMFLVLNQMKHLKRSKEKKVRQQVINGSKQRKWVKIYIKEFGRQSLLDGLS